MPLTLRGCEHVCLLTNRYCCECTDGRNRSAVGKKYVDGVGLEACTREEFYCDGCRDRIRLHGWNSDVYIPHVVPTVRSLECGHKCQLTSVHKCCACSDERSTVMPYEYYDKYIDGRGVLPVARRFEFYCPECKSNGPQILRHLTAAKAATARMAAASQQPVPPPVPAPPAVATVAAPISVPAPAATSTALAGNLRGCGHTCASTSISTGDFYRCCTCALTILMRPVGKKRRPKEQSTAARRPRDSCALCISRLRTTTAPVSAPAPAATPILPVSGRAQWVRDVPLRRRPAALVAASSSYVAPIVAAPSAPVDVDRVEVCLTCESNELFVSSDIPNAVVCTTCHSVYPEGTFSIMSLRGLPRLHPDQEAEFHALLSEFQQRAVAAAPPRMSPPQGASPPASVLGVVSQSVPSKALTQAAVPQSLASLARSLLEELSCTVCLEPFSDPMTLQCGHSVCKACLSTLRKSFKGPGTDCAQCPICRSACTSVTKLNVSSELAFVISVVQSWSLQRGTISTLSDNPQHDLQAEWSALLSEEVVSDEPESGSDLRCACGAGAEDSCVQAELRNS